jgi:hypothetical protein
MLITAQVLHNIARHQFSNPEHSLTSFRPRRYESQVAGSGSGTKADGAASIHIGIATGSVNKITGARNFGGRTKQPKASRLSSTEYKTIGRG